MGLFRIFAFCLSLSQSSILVKLMSIGSSSSAGRRVRRSSAQRRARTQRRVSEGRVSTDATRSASPHRRAWAEQPLCREAHAGGMCGQREGGGGGSPTGLPRLVMSLALDLHHQAATATPTARPPLLDPLIKGECGDVETSG